VPVALGDGIRRNIASVDPAERALLRDAFINLNNNKYPGDRTDSVPGGVTWWFKQDEIHQATHVHGGPEFLPWHREIVNRLEELLRRYDRRLSLHYWDWTQDPRAIPNANLGGGRTGTLNLFTPEFMGYGGSSLAEIGQPWLSARFYVPGASLDRDATGNPADPPSWVNRSVAGSPASAAQDQAIVAAGDYPTMRGLLESLHNWAHGFVNMGGTHISFRDPFVFLLHSNVDRLFALWQTQPGAQQRLDPDLVYGPESSDPGLNGNIEPWSTGHSFDSFGMEHFTRPWYAPESEGVPKTYKDPSVVTPPLYDTTPTTPIWRVSWAGTSRWEEINQSHVLVDSLAFGDFTSDGKTDVFRATGTHWYISEGGVGRWRQINVSRARLPDLAFGDFTGDGKTDVFRADGTHWYLSEGGVGRWRQINVSHVRLPDLAFGDFTGDGKTDVFRATGTHWYISEGGVGTWKRINDSVHRLLDLAFGDFNSDGKTDVFSTGRRR
jgi:hypothetical protein